MHYFKFSVQLYLWRGVWYNVYMKKIKTQTYNFPVIIEKDADGFFVADCPDLAGCHTQGKTYEEALDRIEDAIKLNLKILKEEKSDIPNFQPASFTQIAVSI